MFALVLIDILDGYDAAGDVAIFTKDGRGGEADPDARAVVVSIENLFWVGRFAIEDGAGERILVGFERCAVSIGGA